LDHSGCEKQINRPIALKLVGVASFSGRDSLLVGCGLLLALLQFACDHPGPCKGNIVQALARKQLRSEKLSGNFKIQDPGILGTVQLLDSCEFIALFQWAAKPDTTPQWEIHPPKVLKGNAFLLGRKRFSDGRYMVTVMNDQDTVQQSWMLRYDQDLQLDLVFPLSLSVMRPEFVGIFESNLSIGCDSIEIHEHGECWD
jgi:hypothetical protein